MTDPAMDIAKFLNAKEDGWFAELKMAAESNNNGTIFVNDLPDNPEFAVSISRYEGRGPDETFSNPVQVRNPRIQITIRHARSNIALDRASDIMKFLSTVKDKVLNGTKYQRIRAVGEPFELGPDSKNRQRAIVNLEVSFYDSI